MGRYVNSERGLTLVELMIATAISGVLSLAIMTLLADYSKRMAQNQNEANLSEQLAGFSDFLETYLGNATLIQSCGCGATCIYNDATDCVAGGCTNANIMQFEFEDSVAARGPSPANCILSGGFGAATPDGMIPRGCKHRARLVLTPPTTIASGNPTAGRLDLMPETSAGIVAPGAQPIFSLPGVTSLRCGHPPNPARPGTPATDSFRMVIGVKTKANNFAFGHPEFEAWHPADVPSFARGTHRSVNTEVHFRNFTVAGVHFSKSDTMPSCVIDGALTAYGDCCSGHWDSNTQLCIAAADCLPRDAAMTGIGWECCSKMGVNGLCR